VARDAAKENIRIGKTKNQKKIKWKKEKRRKNSWQIASETYHPKGGVARRVDVCDMGAKLGLFEMKKLEAMQCIAHFPI